MRFVWRALIWILAAGFASIPLYSASTVEPDPKITDGVINGSNNYLIVTIGLFAGLTAFLYFLVQWTMQRLPQERDAMQLDGIGRGNPLTISWIMIVGCGLASIFGANALFVAYLRIRDPETEFRFGNLVPDFLAFAIVPYFLIHLYLFDVLFWYLQNRKYLSVDPQAARLDTLTDLHLVLYPSIIYLMPYAAIAIWEPVLQRKVLLLLALLFLAFGVGAYSAFISDFVPRSIRAVRLQRSTVPHRKRT